MNTQSSKEIKALLEAARQELSNTEEALKQSLLTTNVREASKKVNLLLRLFQEACKQEEKIKMLQHGFEIRVGTKLKMAGCPALH